MTVTAPLYSWTDTVIAEDDYIRVDGVGLLLNGTAPFSLSGWVQPLSEGESVGFLDAMNPDGQSAFQLMFSDVEGGGVVVVVQWSPNGWLATQLPMAIGSWHFLALTFDPTAMQLCVYVDGALGLQATVSAPTVPAGGTFVLTNGYARTNSFNFWTVCLTGAALLPTWGPPAVGTAGLDTSLDLAQLPPVDVSGNNRTVLVGETTSAVWTAPGLVLTGIGCLSPDPQDGLNPGSGSEPFGVQLWAYPLGVITLLNAGAQTLIGNGDIAGAAGLAVYLQVDATGTRWVLAARLGGNAATPILASTTVNPNEWHNYAVTYDGSTLTLYVDGNAAGSGQPAAPASVGTPSVSLGAISDGTWPGGYSHPFVGYLQAVSFWSRALSASDIASNMTTEPDLLDPDCGAYFGLAVGDTINRVTDRQSLLVGAADTALQITEVPISIAPATDRRGAPTAPDRTELDAWLNRLAQAAPDEAPADGPLTAEAVQAMIDDYARLVEQTVPPSLRPQYTELFRTNLHAGLNAVAHDQQLPGTVTYTQDGDDTVFFLHTHAGPHEVYRAKALDPCVAWLASVIGTAVSLFFIVLGLGYAIAKLSSFFVRLFTGNQLAQTLAAAQIIGATVSAWTVIMIIRTMAGITGLVPIITNGLAGVSWWSWAWTIAGAVAQIASIWLTGGWYLAYMIAQIALWIGQLVTVINSKPANCFTEPKGPRLAVATA
jgi:hypothetical protein